MQCIFCQFVDGERKTHSDGLPFKIIHRKEHTISFLSNAVPEKQDGQILVIPIRHYCNIGEVPQYILKELMTHTILIVNILRKNHEGCNILLNEGKSASQTIPHTHFHIIPRDRGDKIRIESYKKRMYHLKNF